MNKVLYYKRRKKNAYPWSVLGQLHEIMSRLSFSKLSSMGQYGQLFVFVFVLPNISECFLHFSNGY